MRPVPRTKTSVFGTLRHRGLLDQVLVSFYFIRLFIRGTHVEKLFVACVVVDEREKAMKLVCVFWVELPSVQLSLFGFW